jgi:protein RecA
MDKQEKIEALKKLVAKHKTLSTKTGTAPIIGFAKDMDVGVKKYAYFDIPILDAVTGGIPAGQFTVVAGPEKGGKSTLVARAIANVQRNGGVAAFVDAERQLDPTWLVKQGVNIEELFVVDDSFLEPALDRVRELLDSKAVDIMVVDSITALGSLQELKDSKGIRSLEDNTIALQARKIAQFFRMSVGLVKKADCAMVLIAQVRIDPMSFGSYEEIPGGNALKHYCSLRLRVRRGAKDYAPKTQVPYVDGHGKEKTRETIAGFRCVVQLDKKRSTRAAMEGTEVAMPFWFDSGFGDGSKAAVLKGENKTLEDIAERQEEIW